MGSLSDIHNFGDWRRFRAWLLAAATALVGAQLLQSARECFIDARVDRGGVVESLAIRAVHDRAGEPPLGRMHFELVERLPANQDEPRLGANARLNRSAAPGEPVGNGRADRGGQGHTPGQWRTRRCYHSGSGLSFVSGRNRRATSPSPKILHIAAPAYRNGSGSG